MLKSYFKNLGADLRAGKPLLHPILVTAAFLAVRQLCYYIIFHFIFDRWYGWDFIGKGIFVFMLEFTCSAYFITLCTHFFARAKDQILFCAYMGGTCHFARDSVLLGILSRRYRSSKRRCVLLFFPRILNRHEHLSSVFIGRM